MLIMILMMMMMMMMMINDHVDNEDDEKKTFLFFLSFPAGSGQSSCPNLDLKHGFCHDDDDFRRPVMTKTFRRCFHKITAFWGHFYDWCQKLAGVLLFRKSVFIFHLFCSRYKNEKQSGGVEKVEKPQKLIWSLLKWPFSTVWCGEQICKLVHIY